MPYYPLSQITSNLYTNGLEYAVDLKNPSNSYSGYYWKTSDGRYFTGKTPQDIPNIEIFVIPNLQGGENGDSAPTQVTINNITVFDGDPLVEDYLRLKNIPPTTVTSMPSYYSPQPTQSDYQTGEFRRYFCKKTNEIQYIEISEATYALLSSKDPQILWQLYFPFYIPWSLTGTKEQVARVNKNIVDLTMKNLKLPRFNDYLKNDYTKYYK
jgi:hypothetical protein